MTRTYHIRRRLRSKRRSAWYLDRDLRYAGTYCGADPTDIDGDWRSKGKTFEGGVDGQAFTAVACLDCLRTREREGVQR